MPKMTEGTSYTCTYNRDIYVNTCLGKELAEGRGHRSKKCRYQFATTHGDLYFSNEAKLQLDRSSATHKTDSIMGNENDGED